MKNHKNLINIVIEEITDYWDSVGVFIGIFMGIYGITDMFTKWGWPYSKEVLGIGILLFIVSGLFHVVKLNNALRDKDKEISSLRSFLQALETQFKDLQNIYANSPYAKEVERLKQPQIIFPKRWKHFDDLVVKGSTPEQIMNYIRDSVSSLWLIHMEIDKVAYDVDYFNSKFFDPQNHNTFLYGAIFDVIKYSLGTKENGTFDKKEIEKIPDMFSISIVHSGSGDESKSTIRFDTNDKDAILFYHRLKEEIGKQFRIESNWLML